VRRASPASPAAVSEIRRWRRRRALTEAFTLVGRPVDEDFGGDNVAEREEHLHELAVTELLGQVVDEQVAALGS